LVSDERVPSQVDLAHKCQEILGSLPAEQALDGPVHASQLKRVVNGVIEAVAEESQRGKTIPKDERALEILADLTVVSFQTPFQPP
jgi:hypothetical protein